MRAATSFAQRGDAVGFFAMVSYLVTIHVEADRLKDAYGLLVLGVSISKRLEILPAEKALRAQIENLKERFGAERIEAVARELLAERRSAGGAETVN